MNLIIYGSGVADDENKKKQNILIWYSQYWSGTSLHSCRTHVGE